MREPAVGGAVSGSAASVQLISLIDKVTLSWDTFLTALNSPAESSDERRVQTQIYIVCSRVRKCHIL